ncbi:MAG: RNA polymerase sigma factor [Dysgonamonadaceae bacterium]|jgi:RNA polymerase sigma-70 factor (ECF subfamily)|nr:RNA polymerase sigma factor [Dysgonamonadaceae bacterium]
MRQDKRFKNTIIPLADKLFRLALSITGNKQDAEDVVQDAMLNVWQKRNKWDQISNLEGYCIRSARNIALDKISLKDNRLVSMPEKADFYGFDPEKSYEDIERLEMIRGMTKNLSEKQGAVFLLRDMEGLSYKEISEIMNITEEQVKVNLFRARQKIKELMDSYEN